MTVMTPELAAKIASGVGKGFLQERCGKYQMNVKVRDLETGRPVLRAKQSSIEVAGPKALAAAEAELMRYRDRLLVERAAAVLEDELREQAELAANPVAAEHRRRLAQPFDKYAAAYFDTLRASRAIERSTHSGYLSSVRTRLGPLLGQEPMSAISTHDVEEVMSALSERGYSRSTLRKDFNLMKAVFSYAVSADGLPGNPMEGLRAPKPAPPRKNALDAPTTAEMLRRLEGMRLTRVTFAARLALNTGLALEEVCGLTWLCAPRPGHECVEVRTVIGKADSGLYVKDPKRASRARRIPTNPAIDALFAEWRAVAEKEWAEAGRAAPSMFDYVIGLPKGSLPQPDAISKGWTEIARASGLVGELGSPPTFHDLRHTFTTRLVASGADIRTAAAILGHSAVQTTLSVYTSVDAGRAAEAMGKIGGELTSPGQEPGPAKPGQDEVLRSIAQMLESMAAGK